MVADCDVIQIDRATGSTILIIARNGDCGPVAAIFEIAGLTIRGREIVAPRASNEAESPESGIP